MIFAVSGVDATVVVKVVPASQTVRGGENFSVNVTIEDVTNMDAAQARLFFDTSAMNATGGIEGEFLKTGGSTFGSPIINNTEGFAGFVYMLLPGGTPVTGSGVVLATMNFNTSDDVEGAFNLNFADVMIGTSAGYVPVDTYNGTISIDNTPPTVEITSPANGDWFGSGAVTVNLTFHPQDNLADALNYSIFINEEDIANGTATNCSEENVSLGMLSEGSYVLKVNVTDHVGLTGSDAITIHVDLTPPRITIQSPEEGKNYSSVSVRLNFTAEDLRSGVNETAYKYNLDGTGNITIAGNTTVSGLTPYDHSINVYAWDKVDEFGYCEVQFTVHPGDISDDLKVDIFDLRCLAGAFFSEPGDPDWNENADLTCDETVDVHDLVIMANYFFTSYS